MRVIRLSLVPEADDPYSVQVFADGSIGPSPVRFLVDTGAGTCLVPLTLATQDLPSLKRSIGTGAANVSAGDHEVVVPRFALEDWSPMTLQQIGRIWMRSAILCSA